MPVFCIGRRFGCCLGAISLEARSDTIRVWCCTHIDERLGKLLRLSVCFFARVSDAFMQTEKRAVIDAVLFKYVGKTGQPPIVVG